MAVTVVTWSQNRTPLEVEVGDVDFVWTASLLRISPVDYLIVDDVFCQLIVAETYALL